MDKKNQHYVPQFHLRQWSYDKKRISLYNKKSRIFVNGNAAIKKIASQRYLYDRDGALENLLGEIETNIAPIYQKILQDQSLAFLTEEERHFIYLHLTLCNERSLLSGERYKELKKAQLEVSLKMHQAHGQFLDIDPKEMLDSISVEFPCNLFIWGAFKYYPLISDLKLILIKNNSEAEFITSDYPTIKYNPWAITRRLISGHGISSVGIMFIMPISPRYALLAYDDSIYRLKTSQHNVIILNHKSQANEINKLMIRNAHEILFFSANIPQKYIENLIKKSPKQNQHPDHISTWGNSESMFISRQIQRIDYVANLTFFDILPESMQLHVPGNFAGLLRPRSKQLGEEMDKLWKGLENDLLRKPPLDLQDKHRI